MTHVAVLGAGIAGAAACLALARAGVRPLWIGPVRPCGDRVGEHLAPAARPLLATLGAGDLLDRPSHRPANVTFSAWGSERISERHAMVHLEGPATVIDRGRFEANLVARAVERGAIRVAAPATGMERDGAVWRIDAGGEVAEARFVVDATGRAAVVARRFATRLRADRSAALVAFLEQDPASDVEPTRATLIESVPEGWWYATLLPDGRLALYFYSDADLMPGAAGRAGWLERLLGETRYVGRWIGEAGFRFDSLARAESAGTVWLAPAAGDGWAAAGDAAAAFDPLSSHGMTTALWTGAKAAEVALASLDGDRAALSAYAAKVAEGVHQFLLSRRRVYAAEERFADAPFWRRRHALAAAA